LPQLPALLGFIEEEHLTGGGIETDPIPQELFELPELLAFVDERAQAALFLDIQRDRFLR
jgi:hypothetical protein